MKNRILFFQLVIGMIAVMVGLFLFITHYDKTTGTFLIKCGLIFEAIIVVRLFFYNRNKHKVTSR